MIWLENPASLDMEIADLDMIAAFARKHDLISVCDNSFATPCLQQPLNHGIDLVVHTETGYMFGDSDIRLGAVVLGQNRAMLFDRLDFVRSALGVAASVTYAGRRPSRLISMFETLFFLQR